MTSAGTALPTSTVLKRANVLLLNLGEYRTHYERVVRLCVLGSELYPETFTKAFCEKTKAKVNIMKDAYEVIEA